MQRESAKFLYDMLEAARAIEQMTHGHTEDDYLNARQLRDACNWNFCVIGEALTRLRRLDERTAERISEYTRIIGLRNQLIHGYDHISDTTAWSIIRNKLPILISELDQLLKE